MKIGIIGSHSLREEILSAILCMQMLQVKLEIFILAPDAADFWRRYISDHFGIKDAVILFYSIDYDSNGQIRDMDYNFITRKEFLKTYQRV